MKQEARVQLRGRLTHVLKEDNNGRTYRSIVVAVRKNDTNTDEFKLRVFESDLLETAKKARSKEVLVLGTMAGGISKSGYYNATFTAHAIYVTPGDDWQQAAPAPEPVSTPDYMPDENAPELPF